MKQQVDPLDVVGAYAPPIPVDADRLMLARAQVERELAQTSPSGPARSARVGVGVQRRWIAAAAVVGVLAVAGVLVPTLSTPSAFATWTPVPTVLSGEEAEAAGQACIESVSGGPVGLPGWPEVEELDAFTTLLSERRGDWAFSLVGAQGWVASCLGSADENGGRIEQFDTSPIAADAFDLTSVGGSLRDDAAYSYTFGRAGSDVTGVDITLTTGEVVAAAVVNGLYSAWWPGDPRDDATVTVHLRDGTTRGPLPVEAMAARPSP